jgi:hypothetical protein
MDQIACFALVLICSQFRLDCLGSLPLGVQVDAMWQSASDEYHGSHVAFNGLGVLRELRKRARLEKKCGRRAPDTPEHAEQVRSPPSYWRVSYPCGACLMTPKVKLASAVSASFNISTSWWLQNRQTQS